MSSDAQRRADGILTWVEERPKRTLVSWVEHAVIKRRLSSSTIKMYLRSTLRLDLFTEAEVHAAEQQLAYIDRGQRTVVRSSLTTLDELDDATGGLDLTRPSHLRLYARICFWLANPACRSRSIDTDLFVMLAKFSDETEHSCGNDYCISKAITLSGMTSEDAAIDFAKGTAVRTLIPSPRRSVTKAQVRGFHESGLGARRISLELGLSLKAVRDTLESMTIDPDSLMEEGKAQPLAICRLGYEYRDSLTARSVFKQAA